MPHSIRLMSAPLLSQARERLGFKRVEVATAAGWSRQRYAEIERSGELTVEDGLVLSDLLGIDVAALLERQSLAGSDFAVAALLKGNAETLTAHARFAITEALSVARDVREVERLLGKTPIVPVTDFREDDDLRHPADGGTHRELAAQVRDRLGLPPVIGSIVRDVADPLGIIVVRVPFRDLLVDAVSTWTPSSGAIIIINEDSSHGRGEYALRVTLAHEICHLLFDRNKMREVGSLGELERPKHSVWPEEHESIERRARAFQAEFIAPVDLVHAVWNDLGKPTGREAIVALSNHFGSGAVAMSWQLEHVTGVHESFPGLTASLATSAWHEESEVSTPAEPASVPRLRRAMLLGLVKQGWESGELSSSWARELLRIDTTTWEQLAAQWST